AISADGSTAAVALPNAGVALVDLRTGAVQTARIPSWVPDTLAFSPTDGRLFVAAENQWGAASLFELSVPDLAVVDSFEIRTQLLASGTPGTPRAFDVAGTTPPLTNAFCGVLIVALASHAVTAVNTGPGKASAVVFARDGRRLFVGTNVGDVQVLDVARPTE